MVVHFLLLLVRSYSVVVERVDESLQGAPLRPLTWRSLAALSRTTANVSKVNPSLHLCHVPTVIHQYVRFAHRCVHVPRAGADVFLRRRAIRCDRGGLLLTRVPEKVQSSGAEFICLDLGLITNMLFLAVFDCVCGLFISGDYCEQMGIIKRANRTGGYLEMVQLLSTIKL